MVVRLVANHQAGVRFPYSAHKVIDRLWIKVCTLCIKD